MTEAVKGGIASPPAPLDSPETRRRRHLQYAGLWTLGIAVPAVVFAAAGLYNPGMEVSDSTPTILGVWALLYPLYVYRLHLIRLSSFALILALASITVATVSIVTGWGNGMTDEPYAMPIFIQPILHGQNPYTTPIYLTYNQYGTIYHIGPTTYIYLPLLMFLQPFYGGGTGYKVFAVATWAAIIYLVRKDAFAVVAIGQPYMALLAASGFNDFPVLLLLTVAFVGINGKRQQWAKYIALGCKQFANVLVVGYYAIQRDWRNLTIAVAVSLAWVLPFLLWNPSAFICDAVLLSPSGCAGASGSGVLLHLNYWAWPVWVLAVFFLPLRQYYHRILTRVRRGSGPPAPKPVERNSETPSGLVDPEAPPLPVEPPPLGRAASPVAATSWGRGTRLGRERRPGDAGPAPAESSG
jgi:hypothetical protein